VSDSSRHFEDFASHTLLKHRTYASYVERWARILLYRPPLTRLRIVDACAGSGGDEAGNPGSPLIAVREADAAARQMSEHRGTPVTIEVVAIEKDPARFAELARRMAPHAGRHRALPGTLADHIADFERDFASVPTLFFIDPFGLEPLRADVVKRCLAGSRNEVFLLFADQAALRHWGVIAARDEDPPSPELDLFGEAPAAREPRTSPAAIDITAAAAERIMDAVFGSRRWRDVITATARPRRRQAFVDLYVELLKEFGAGRVLPLPVIGEQHKYHLIYATHSPFGYGVMKQEVERGWKSGLVGARATELMRLGTSVSRTRLRGMVETAFAGREVSWGDEDRRVPSIRRHVLENTPAMPHQLDALKDDLQARRVPGMRRLVYRFPRS
jgi:three-Cys-motif partner protein